MPRSFKAGTFDGPPHYRWTKMYLGVRYRITCEHLGLPRELWTKEGSYRAANDWWQQRKAEIDLANRPPERPPFPMEDVARLRLVHEFRTADEKMARLQAELEELRERGIHAPDLEQQLLDGGMPLDIWEPEEANEGAEARTLTEAELWAYFSKELGPAFFKDLLARKRYAEEALLELPEARQEQLRAAVATVRNEPPADAERSVQVRCARWIENQQKRLRSAKQADNLRGYLNHFRDFIGGTADVQSITAERLEGFYYVCREKVEERRKDPTQKVGWSSDHAKKVFDTSRRFVHWLVGLGLIAEPKNLDSREFKFDVGQKDKTAWTREEFQLALSAATAQLRLHLLLMANCGFGQVDISGLKNKEVNWKEGRIAHKRDKTRGCENVPTVDYKLWGLTFDLLKQHRNTDRSPDALLLLDEEGKPWYTEAIVNGKLEKRDGIYNAFDWLRRKLAKRGRKLERSLKELRKTGSTLLEMDANHSRFGNYFLGHSGGSIRSRYYLDMKQLRSQFDEAVAFIGEKLLKGFKGWRANGERAEAARPARRKKQAN
jgi:hypothetical protein